MGEKKAADMRDLGVQFEDLKKDVAEMAKALKAELRERVSTAHQKIVSNSKEWIKEHPAQSVGIIAGVAAAIGFMIGLAVGRR